MKKVLFVLSLLFITVCLFPLVTQAKRGFYIAFGGGPGMMSYGEPTDSFLDSIEGMPYMEKISIGTDFSIGWAINTKLYLVGNFFSYSDYYWNAESMIMTGMIALGVRYYPSTTGIVLGTDIGSASQVFYRTSALNREDGSGFGGDLMIAYDIDKTITGFTLMLGVKIGGYYIKGHLNKCGIIFYSIVWK